MNSHYLDITKDVCPLTFVKTRLMIDRMAEGDVAEIRLCGSEPLGNVPRSVREHGHEVLSLAPLDEEQAGDEAVHVLRIRKCPAGSPDKTRKQGDEPGAR